jgi:hypothetical protein
MAGLQDDLDLVARCAGAAINHPAAAKMPVPFAVDEGGTYPRGSVPAMPPSKAGVQRVLVPDLKTCSSWVECQQRVTSAGLVAASEVAVGAPASSAFTVRAQSPEAGTRVPSGTVVTAFTAPPPPAGGGDTSIHGVTLFHGMHGGLSG